MKLWQWIVGMALTALIAIGGSVWSVGTMRADDMQRLAKAEVEITNLKYTNMEIKASLLRIEEDVNSIRRATVRDRTGRAWDQ
jgi:hypothetical protein